MMHVVERFFLKSLKIKKLEEWISPMLWFLNAMIFIYTLFSFIFSCIIIFNPLLFKTRKSHIGLVKMLIINCLFSLHKQVWAVLKHIYIYLFRCEGSRQPLSDPEGNPLATTRSIPIRPIPSQIQPVYTDLVICHYKQTKAKKRRAWDETVCCLRFM